MPKTVWTCDTCGKAHETEAAALACEALGVLNQQPEIEVGMLVTANDDYCLSPSPGRQPCDWTVHRTAEENVAHYGFSDHLTNHAVLDAIYVVVGFGPSLHWKHEGAFYLVSFGARDSLRGKERFVWNTGPKTHHRMYPLNPEDHPAVAAKVPDLLNAYRGRVPDGLL